jgi:hypothetical protein
MMIEEEAGLEKVTSTKSVLDNTPISGEAEVVAAEVIQQKWYH